MSSARVVVACRLPGALRFGDRPTVAIGELERVVERAASLGGILVASSYDGVVFAWDEAAIQEAVSLATGITHGAQKGEVVWACGIASGNVEAGKTITWGEPIASASALARLAKAREVLVDLSVPAVVSHELLTNRARIGQVGKKRIRGFRVDSRQAWRSNAAADVARMVDPPLIGRTDELVRLVASTGVVILRADSGFGGSRILAEVAAMTRPSRTITLTPFATVDEPLGALRRALAFVAATERITLPPELHPVLDQLLGAQGVSIDNAALLIAHQVRGEEGEAPPSILLDDVTDLDEPSVEACARAIQILGPTAVRVVARVDSMSQLPRTLSRYSDGAEVVLGRLDPEHARALAAACTGDALEVGARVQWARRGGGTPLGVVEAVAAGIAKGELLFSGDSLTRLQKTKASEVARPVGYWIARRAESLRETSREVLIALAYLGGEASANELAEVMGMVMPEVDLAVETVVLRRGRWIREPRPGMFELATRAQREAILEFSRSDHTHEWRAAVAQCLERAPGTLRRAEAAQHAARAGMGEWAARLAMAAARTAAEVGLEESASTLAAFAGTQDPAHAELDLGELSIDDIDIEETSARSEPPREPLAAPRATVVDAVEADDTDDMDDTDGPPTEARPLPKREAEPEELDIEPDPDVAAEAQEAAYQTLLDAAQELRETRWAELARRSLAPGASAEVQRRGLLALARAYAHEGRSQEALLHALGALARMREAHDGEGIRTCLLFLARLYEKTDHRRDADALKQAAATA